MRCFRCLADDATYEAVRLQLDSAFGHPNPATKTATCIDPAALAPRDDNGRIILATDDEFCTYEAVAAVLPQLLASGAVEEITEAEYRGALPRLPTPNA